MKKIKEILTHFKSTSLEEMDNVKLMNRTDTKFFFNIDKLGNILIDAKEKYDVLEINKNRILNYKTLYFDTEDFGLYTAHQNGKLNRYKIRHRQYVESDISFFEVKFKSNKGRTIKKRIKRPNIEEVFSKKSEKFIRSNSPLNPDDLKPKLYNKFSRITLVSKTDAERITIDLNLGYQTKDKETNLPFMVIAEVKKDGYSTASDIMKILHNNRVYPEGFSKYCVGTTLLNDNVKHNRFKQKLLTINKISNDQFNAFTK